MKIRLQCFFLAFFLAVGLTTTMNAQTVILDFESEETSTTFPYFGSALDGSLNSVIANPDPSGINTSANVSEFMKPADAEVWAGAFTNPDPATAINVLAGNEICMKVWFANPGNVAIKLEMGGSSPNWVTTQPVTETNQWVEVCFDTNVASEEDPFLPAAGGVFARVVLFFDFQVAPTADNTYYMDDLVVDGETSDPSDITFSVDMNSYGGSYTNVFVSGTFNDWSSNANPLSDDDGDGVWTGTVAGLDAGSYEYKFQVDEWADQEEFMGNFTCTVTDGEFTNRALNVSTSAELETVCWASCYACGEAVKITVNLGGQSITVSDQGLYIAGGGNFGNPGDFPLLDGNGDGVYSMTFERQTGFESYYTFTNGACGDYSCKEDITGQSCANEDNFNDRFMGPFTEDATINTCFGECTEDTNCAGPPKMVTFSVDMNNYAGSYTTVFLSGSFNDWSGGANPMADDDGDGVFTTTVEIPVGPVEYKFQLDEWAVSEQFTDGDPCTITDESGEFVNRFLEVGEEDVEVCFEWETCTSCLMVGVSDLDAADDLFKVAPSLVQSSTTVILNETYRGQKKLILFNTLGEILRIETIGVGIQEYLLSADNLESGLYYLNIQTDGVQQTQRFIVNR